MHYYIKLGFYLALSALLISCQNLSSGFSHQPAEESFLEAGAVDVDTPGQDDYEPRTSSQLVEQLKEVVSVDDVVIEQRAEVDVWIRYFTGRGRDQMKLYLERSSRYMDLMRSVFKKQSLPQNLIFMAMIESGFSSKARSRANAVGYWQFIESTGRRYGLKVNYLIDERRDPLLSTEAAGKYLKDLYELFGSWHLAMAAYNAGEYRVNRAMMRNYTRDFWKLTNKRSIPRETRNYVPKFMAAQMIAQNPKKYGFKDLQYKPPISFELIAIHHPVSLKKLAKSLSINPLDLKALNPKYVSNYVPLNKNKTAVIRVPIGFSEKVTPEVITQSFMARPRNVKTYVYYKVRRGDTLYGLSRRNRTTVNTLRRMNGLSRRSMLIAGKVIKLPRCYNCLSQPTADLASFPYYQVKRGDSLARVAGRYGVLASQIKKWNKLSGSIIHPGQMLRVKAPKAAPSSGAHIVKKGESLRAVARLYGLQVSQIKKWNKISGSIIHPNQKLKITADGNKTHIVKKGETLISISKKYKVPLVSLMEKNSMNFKSILGVGRTLVIP